MFLKRRASKLLGIKAEKFILTVEILDLHVDLARAEKAEPKPLPGASYVLCLEKRGRSATSAKRTIALDQSGVNPLAEGRVSTTLLSAFSIPVLERLQMIITLYKDSSSSSGYRNKTVKIVWKVFQSDPVLGIEICPPFAVAALRVDELVAKDINLNGETELTIPFDGLPNSFVKLRASAVSIAATAGDEGEEASSGSEVGFDYDDLLIAEEHSTPNSATKATSLSRRNSYHVARRSSYLAENTSPSNRPPAAGRRSFVVQRAKSHLSSLFSEIKEDDKEDASFDELANSTLEMLDERLSTIGPPPDFLASPILPRSRGSSRATPLSMSVSLPRMKKLIESPRDSPSVRNKKSTRSEKNYSWTKTLFTLAVQEVRKLRERVHALESKELLSLSHEEERESQSQLLEEKDREICTLRDQLSALQEKLKVLEDTRAASDGEDDMNSEDIEPSIRQSFLVSPDRLRGLTVSELDENSLAQMEILRTEVGFFQNQAAALLQEQEELRFGLRDAANKIVESCLQRAELECELEDVNTELADYKDLNAALLADLEAAKKKNFFAARSAQRYRELYTQLEVKYRSSFIPSASNERL